MAQTRDVGRRYAGRLGDRIAQRRADLELKQSDVADRMSAMGITTSSQTVSAWEYGRPRIAIHQIVGLAAALECTTSFLLGLTDKIDKWTPDGPLKDAATRVKRAGNPSHLEPITGGRRGPPPSAVQIPIVR